MNDTEVFNESVKKLIRQDLERAKNLSKASIEKADRIFEHIQYKGSKSLDSIIAENPIDGMTLLLLLSKAVSRQASIKASSKNADMRAYIEGRYKEEFDEKTDAKKDFARDAVSYYLPGKFPDRDIPTIETVEGWLPKTGRPGRKKKDK